MPVTRWLLPLILTVNLAAAISGNVRWDIRSTGNDLNGGGFNTVTAGGVDRSQSDTPFVTFDGATIRATTAGTSATLTVVGYTVVAGDAGNVLNITGGTNFTPGWYEITSVNAGANTWTCDRNVSSGAGAAMTGRMGGGFATLGAAWPLLADGSVSYLKTGTYTLTSTLQNGTGVHNFGLIGYGSSHGDFGTAPLVTSATNSVVLFTLGSNAASSTAFFMNISMSHTAATRGNCIQNNDVSSNTLSVVSVTMDGCAKGIAGTGGLGAQTITRAYIADTEIKNCTGDCVQLGGEVSLDHVYIHNSTGKGLFVSNSNAVEITHSIFAANTNFNLDLGTTYKKIINCTIAGGGTDGLNMASTSWASGVPAFIAENNVFYGNAGWGINAGVSSSGYFPYAVRLRNNAYGANSNGATNNLGTTPWISGNITLTADPFVSSAAGNYALNNSTGGGALLKRAGYPGVFPGATSTGNLDVGAVQSSNGTPRAYGAAQ